MKTSTPYSPEVRARAVCRVREHQDAHDSQGAAISSIAAKIGCTAETLRRWVRQAENALAETINGLYKAEVIHQGNRAMWGIDNRLIARVTERG